jgi:hypothetical protein
MSNANTQAVWMLTASSKPVLYSGLYICSLGVCGSFSVSKMAHSLDIDKKRKKGQKLTPSGLWQLPSDLGKPALEYYLTSGFQKPLKYINCSPFFSVAFHFWIFFLLYLQGRNCDREFNNVEIFNINHYSKF